MLGSKGRVLVTGASSYIGMHAIAALLRAGYTVRGTTRDLGRVPELRAALPDGLGSPEQLEFVPLDMLDDFGWPEAVAGCNGVMHLASPFPAKLPRDPNGLVQPAAGGTRRALSFAAKAGARRVVVLSSLAAVHLNHPPGRTDYDESDWSVVDANLDAYSTSKTRAEQAAWQLVEEDGGAAPELVVLAPGYVLGPPLPGTYSTSLDWVRRPMAGEVPGYVDVAITLTDVRDLALLLSQALQVERAAGKRVCVTGHILGYGELVQHLAELYRPAGRKVPTRKLPGFLVRMMGLVDPTIAALVPLLGRKVNIDTSRLHDLFDYEPRPVRETLRDTVDALTAAGRL